MYTDKHLTKCCITHAAWQAYNNRLPVTPNSFSLPVPSTELSLYNWIWLCFVGLLLSYAGTGKSITGAHIAYAFALLNRKKAAQESATTDASEGIVKDHKETDEAEGTTNDVDASGIPPLQCVVYCGPSNASVDVVLSVSCSATLHIYVDVHRLVFR